MRALFFTLFLLAGFIPVMAAAETAAAGEDDTEFEQMSILNPSKEFQVFLDLAKAGDSRAQFILGDIYAKGRSGLQQSDVKARKWFERAARQGYDPALVRLAALEKRVGDPVAAYKWYELALDRFNSDTKTYAFVKEAQRDLVREANLDGKQQGEARHLASLWAQGKKSERTKEGAPQQNAAPEKKERISKEKPVTKASKKPKEQEGKKASEKPEEKKKPTEKTVRFRVNS